MGVICTLDQVLWRHGLLNQKVPLTEPIAWKLTPRAHAEYLRHMIIHWLIAKHVDLKMFGRANSPHFEVTGIKQLASTASDDTSESYQPAYGGPRIAADDDEIPQCHHPPTGIASTEVSDTQQLSSEPAKMAAHNMLLK